jgi:uncharacterized protein (DUF433 family)
MAEFTETTKYIKLNRHGTPVLAETNTNIVAIGEAHENGATEEWLLNQYEISRAVLHAALSYYYEHLDAVRAYQEETDRLLQEYGTDGWAALEKLRKRV